MSRPTFASGVLAAGALAAAGAVLAAVFLPSVGGAWGLRLLATALALAYLLYLLNASGIRTGRVVVLAAWAAGSAGALALLPGLGGYLLLQGVAIWLVRSLYVQRGVLAAMADGGLGILAAAAALWAFGRTGSLFAAILAFFLVQALHVALPASGTRKSAPAAAPPDTGFDRARRRAEAALEQLMR